MTPIHPAVKQLQAERAEKERRRQERAEKAYDPAYVQICAGLAALGRTQKEMAEAIGVSQSQITRWKKAHPDFDKALQVGKKATLGRLASVGLQLALGEYVHEESKLHYNKDSGALEVVTIQNRLPPSERMLLHFLGKMDPQEDQGEFDGIDINLRVLGGADA